MKFYHDFNFISDWPGHYNSWKNISFCPIKIIKYEDFIVDSEKIFISTLKFLSKFIKFEFNSMCQISGYKLFETVKCNPRTAQD